MQAGGSSLPDNPTAGGTARKATIGPLQVDALTFAQALAAIEALVDAGRGGAVFTPNVDHVVLAEADAAFRRSYASASLSLADGMPLVWASRLLGCPLPEKISGSDLALPLLQRAAARGFRVYLLGAGPGVADKAAEVLRSRFGVEVAGTDAPFLRDPCSAEERAPIVEKIRRAAPHLCFVAFGAPKQELFIHAARDELAPAVSLGIGATLDFIAGNAQRAPRFMSEHGLEWLYRLCREPRRLWRRYLLRDPRFALIVAQALLRRRVTGTTGPLLPPAPPPS